MRLYDDLHDGPMARLPDSVPTWRVACYPIVMRGGRVLMVEPVWADRWELPGGGVEAALEETLAEAAARECFEETGFRVIPDATSLAFQQEAFFSIARAQAYFHSLIFTVIATVGDDPGPDWRPPADEIRRVAWIDPAATQEVLHPIHRAALMARGIIASRGQRPPT